MITLTTQAEQILASEGASLVAIQQPLSFDDEPMVLFTFSGETEIHALPAYKFTAEEVRSKRRVV